MKISLETSPGLYSPNPIVYNQSLHRVWGSSFCPRILSPCFNKTITFAPKISQEFFLGCQLRTTPPSPQKPHHYHESAGSCLICPTPGMELVVCWSPREASLTPSGPKFLFFSAKIEVFITFWGTVTFLKSSVIHVKAQKSLIHPSSELGSGMYGPSCRQIPT